MRGRGSSNHIPGNPISTEGTTSKLLTRSKCLPKIYQMPSINSQKHHEPNPTFTQPLTSSKRNIHVLHLLLLPLCGSLALPQTHLHELRHRIQVRLLHHDVMSSGVINHPPLLPRSLTSIHQRQRP